jgi:hypothetical protein
MAVNLKKTIQKCMFLILLLQIVAGNVLASVNESSLLSQDPLSSFIIGDSNAVDAQHHHDQSSQHCEQHCNAYQCHSNALLQTMLTHLPRPTNIFSTLSLTIAFNSLHYPPAVPPPNA